MFACDVLFLAWLRLLLTLEVVIVYVVLCLSFLYLLLVVFSCFIRLLCCLLFMFGLFLFGCFGCLFSVLFISSPGLLICVGFATVFVSLVCDCVLLLSFVGLLSIACDLPIDLCVFGFVWLAGLLLDLLFAF